MFKLRFRSSGKKKTLHKASFKIGENPSADWLRLLSCFSILIIASVALSALVFIKINEGDFFGEIKAGSGSIEAIDRSKVERVSELLEKRTVRFNEASTDTSVVDPGQ